MPPISLTPIKETLLDLMNILHHATLLELKLRRIEEWNKKLDILDTNMNGDASSESDDDLELTVSDGSAITKEKKNKSLDVRQFRAELEQVLNVLQAHHETPSEGFLSTDEAELAQRYAQKLISWFEGIRGHLIEILGRSRIILNEKEERKKKTKEDRKFIQELLDQMASLRACATRTEMKLNDMAKNQKSHTSAKKTMEPTPTLPDAMDVDGDDQASQTDTAATGGLSSTGSDFVTLLKDTTANLGAFRASQQTYAIKADSLHHQSTKVFQCAPPGRPIIPVRNVEIDLDPTIRQIVLEESELLYRHFLATITEEIGKKGEATGSNLTKTMTDANKVVCKLLVSCLGCDELGVLDDVSLNRRQDYSSESDTIISLN